jgi:type IV pilus assembly protein PilA
MFALRSERGFTLVELMVVVLIIGILVAVSIPVFNNASGTARKRTCQTNQRTIEGAVQQWLAASSTNQWAVSIIDNSNVLITSNYLKDEPACVTATGGLYSVNASGTVDGDQGAATWVVDGLITHSHF